MAAQDLLGRSSGNTCFEVFTTTKSLRGVEGTKAFDAMTSREESWGSRIPGIPDALWTWCLEQDQQVLLDLLAFCMARSVNAVRMKKDSPDDHRFAYADRLADTLKLDMNTWFTPTAGNYFGKVSKTGILEALTEAKGDIAPPGPKPRKAISPQSRNASWPKPAAARVAAQGRLTSFRQMARLRADHRVNG